MTEQTAEKLGAFVTMMICFTLSAVLLGVRECIGMSLLFAAFKIGK